MPAPLAAELSQRKQTLSDWAPTASARAAQAVLPGLWEGAKPPPACRVLPSYPLQWVSSSLCLYPAAEFLGVSCTEQLRGNAFLPVGAVCSFLRFSGAGNIVQGLAHLHACRYHLLL